MEKKKKAYFGELDRWIDNIERSKDNIAFYVARNVACGFGISDILSILRCFIRRN